MFFYQFFNLGSIFYFTFNRNEKNPNQERNEKKYSDLINYFVREDKEIASRQL